MAELATEMEAIARHICRALDLRGVNKEFSADSVGLARAAPDRCNDTLGLTPLNYLFPRKSIHVCNFAAKSLHRAS